MLESENIDAIVAITVAVVFLGLVAFVAVWLFGKLFRSEYSPFKFVSRLLDVETPIRITTPLSPDAAVRRLKDRITRIGVPVLMSNRLVGRVTDSGLRVRLHHQFMSNTFGPIFAGAIATENGQTVLQGVYRLHKYALYFMKFWFGFIIVWSTMGIPAGIIQLIAGKPEGALFVVVPFVMFGFGILFVRFGRYFGDKDNRLIAEELADAIEGTVSAA